MAPQPPPKRSTQRYRLTQKTTTGFDASASSVTLQDLSYVYDAVGNITQIVDASDTDTAKTIDYVYDDLYRLTSATVSGSADGNDGTISYAYDAIGNITSRSDMGTYAYEGDAGSSYANPHAVTSIVTTDGSSVTYTYDNNGNLTSDSSTGSEPSATYTWDYKNRLTSSGEPSTTTTTETIETTTNVYSTSGDGYAYKNDVSWDTAHDALLGANAVSTSPTALTGTAKTDGDYFIYRSFLPFVTSTLPDDATITSASLNVFVNSKKNGNNDGDDYVTVVQTSQSSATRVTLDDYDQAGDVDNPTEGIDSTDRADLSSIPAGAYRSFPLNATGLSWISTTGLTKLGLREGHDAIDSAITPTPPIAPQVYDQLTIRTSEYPGTSFDPYLSITYTQTTESTTTTTDSVSYAYDHAMRRVSKTSDVDTTHYPSGDYSVSDGTSTVYVSGPVGLVASVKDDGTTSSTSTIHPDHLGSTSVVTDEDGIMVELLDYDPYGTERSSWSSSADDGEAESQKTYIGEYSDDETGLSYLNARYYDPQRGQFLSQDPVYLSLGSGMDKREQILLLDPQSQNSYLYGRGNPIAFIDPWGDLQVHTEGATDEQIDQFNTGLLQLQQDVKDNSSIQQYYQDVYGINILEVLSNPDKGPDVYLNDPNSDFSERLGISYWARYDGFAWFNDVYINQDIYTQENSTQLLGSSLLHELEHWAGDIYSWFGTYRPDYSRQPQFEWLNESFDAQISDGILEPNAKTDHGVWGYSSQLILYGKIDR